MRMCNQNSLFQRDKNSQAGLAALEFIICLPVLLMLAVLLIDVSRAFIQYTEINKALQNGARYAVVDTYGDLDSGSIAEPGTIKNMVVYGSPIPTDTPVLKFIDETDVMITLPTDESKEVTISVNYNYEPIFSGLPFTDKSLSFTIDASSKMRTSP
ncbi:TadE/TadG family type IV pilus assembly protein [Vibrio sp. YIC-376]|uniref:TadE/TadG family type IV pilus assembly protein n=1 Tax=Vibrio sp. YIC-376 TaxID=3136162 RepID=UPI00402A82B5